VPAIDSILVLLAADIWQVVFGIIVFVLYSVGQLIAAKEQAKKKPAKPRRPRRPQGPEALGPEARGPEALGPEVRAPEGQGPARRGLERQGQAVAGQGNQEEALRREVEDFLRRAQGKPPRQEEPVRPQPRTRPRKQTPNRPPAKRPVAERSKAGMQPLPSESKQPASDLRREGVAEHVASHLSSKKMIEHAEHLGVEVELSDKRLETRLHQKFDHQLGSLVQEEKPAAAKKRELSAAEEVVELLRKPGGMRQIVIAQEILQRPEW